MTSPAAQAQYTQQDPSAAHDPQAFQGGYEHGPYIVPPRTDYDYSPLDLVPPGQRRRRQLIAGLIGALSILLLGALLWFGYTLLHDDTSENGKSHNVNEQNKVAVATQSPVAKATESAKSTPSAKPTKESAAVNPGAKPTSEATAGPSTGSGQGPTEAELKGMLPTSGVPEGFDSGADSTLTKDKVVEALGSSRVVEQNLDKWGWTANVSRTYTNASAVEGSTSVLSASLHGFKDAPSTQEALEFYSSILLNNGATAVDVAPLGNASKAMTSTDENGITSMTIYVAKDNVLYKFTGYMTGGDPTADVVAFAQAALGQ